MAIDLAACGRNIYLGSHCASKPTRRYYPRPDKEGQILYPGIPWMTKCVFSLLAHGMFVWLEGCYVLVSSGVFPKWIMTQTSIEPLNYLLTAVTY